VRRVDVDDIETIRFAGGEIHTGVMLYVGLTDEYAKR